MDVQGADEMLVAGYVACACGAWIAAGADGSSTGVCPECRAELASADHEHRVRYEIEGRTLVAAPRAPRKAKKRTQNLSDEARQRRNAADRARRRAEQRLVRIYRPMYDVLLAEEYLREGLPPIVTHGPPRPKAIAAELLRDIEDAADRHGPGLRREA